MAAVSCVTTALVLYSIGTVREHRSHRATAGVRGFLTLGVLFDVTATALMIVATERQGWTLHGVLGYSALAAMSLDTFLIWRHWRRHGEAEIPRGLHLYSRWAYVYWVVAYFTGAALVMGSRMAGAPTG
jgi:hypothetical protein